MPILNAFARRRSRPGRSRPRRPAAPPRASRARSAGTSARLKTQSQMPATAEPGKRGRAGDRGGAVTAPEIDVSSAAKSWWPMLGSRGDRMQSRCEASRPSVESRGRPGEQRRPRGPAQGFSAGSHSHGTCGSPGSLDRTSGARPPRGRSRGCWPGWPARPGRRPSPRPARPDRRPAPPWRARRTPRSARGTWPRRRAPRPCTVHL